MKKVLFAILALGAFAAIDTTSAAARDYEFCLMGRDFAGYGDCQFDTYAQCQATASGRDAYCGANPYFRYSDNQAASPRKRRIVR